MVIVARTINALNEVRDEIHAIDEKIKVLIVPTDLMDPESIMSMWTKVEEKFGHADVLINNAGSLQTGTMSELPVEKWWTDFVGFHCPPIISTFADLPVGDECSSRFPSCSGFRSFNQQGKEGLYCRRGFCRCCYGFSRNVEL